MQKKLKRVGFKIEISPKIGFGHYSRARTLFNTLPEGYNGTLIVPENQFQYLPASSLPCIVWSPLENPDIPEFDIVFFDQLSTDRDFLGRSRRTAQLVIGLDFFDYDCPFMDKIINLFEQNPEGAHKFQGEILQGLEYAIIDSDRFEQRFRRTSQVPERISKVLVCFGGADPANLAEKVARFLHENKNLREIHLIIGPLKNIAQDFEAVVGQDRRFRVHRSPSNLPEIMHSCDLAFSSGSTIFFELSYLGIPTIILPQNEREKRFSHYLASLELCLLAEPDLENSFERIQSKSLRANLQGRARNIFDGYGPNRILREAEILA